MPSDYKSRAYLSVNEVASHTGIEVNKLHQMVRAGELSAFKSAGGQYRFRLEQIRHLIAPTTEAKPATKKQQGKNTADNHHHLNITNTQQQLITTDARHLPTVDSNSVHLVVTSPPYFNAKMYSDNNGDLGNVHDLSDWLAQIGEVWREMWRVLQPGRKCFINIMNLPLRENNTYRSLNLVGKTIDLCEEVGFVFKRDIIWHKTNGVRAHFGTYPYPGGILINNMHETILEFQKPATASQAGKKYTHVTPQQREDSKLDKDFWLSLKNSDVWLMKPENSGGNRTHAAPFPFDLPARLIRAYSFVGETVLDPFVGSGTTCLAAAVHGRNGIGIDINPQFTAIAHQRLDELNSGLL